jgi:hypothetical protein
MRVAAKARSVAATSMNAQSSRSHTVFTLRLQCTQTVPNGKGGVNKTVRKKNMNMLHITFLLLSAFIIDEAYFSFSIDSVCFFVSVYSYSEFVRS